MTGDADEANESLVPSLHTGAERPVVPEGLLPALLVGQVVELDQIDLLDLQPLERGADLIARALVAALAGLRR